MRRRNMYYLTGLPGWMRFGYSPGWIGRSPSGLGPCAEYLLTGRWPLPQAPMAGTGTWPFPFAGAQAGAGSPMDRQQRLAFLQAQASLLEQQLEAIREQLKQLEAQS